jgi:hypothetical protein
MHDLYMSQSDGSATEDKGEAAGGPTPVTHGAKTSGVFSMSPSPS